VAGEVVGIDHFAVSAFVAGVERFDDVERAVVVGELFAGADVAHGQLKAVGGGDAVGLEAVVHEARVVPAEDIIAVPVAVGIFIKRFAADGGKRRHLLRAEEAVERIHHPGDGAFGNVADGDNAATDLFTDPSDFCIGVQHAFPVV